MAERLLANKQQKTVHANIVLIKNVQLLIINNFENVRNIIPLISKNFTHANTNFACKAFIDCVVSMCGHGDP